MATKMKSANDVMEKAMEAGQERLEQAFKTGAEATQKNFEKATEFSRKQMDEAAKAFEEMSSFAKGNVEALVASSQAAAKGFETLSQAMTAYQKKSADEFQGFWKSLTASKSAKDFFEIQNASLKTGYDAFVAESSKMMETSMKVMSDVVEPLSNRVALAVEKVTKPVAAK